jgi:hypothetical protein
MVLKATFNGYRNRAYFLVPVEDKLLGDVVGDSLLRPYTRFV